MKESDYLFDGASKYHRWARIGGKLLKGIFANRCALYPYDVKYLRNHDVPSMVNLDTKPLDSNSKLPKIYTTESKVKIPVSPSNIVAVFNDCIYYKGVKESAHNFALQGARLVIVNFIAMPSVDGIYKAYDNEASAVITGGLSGTPLCDMIANDNEYSYQHPVF